jgi:hypothetical protein
MARTISADALDVIGSGAEYTTNLTVTIPGDEPRDIEHERGWSVNEKAPAVAGSRLGISSVQLLPSDGVDDLFEFAGYPGAIYDLSIGINLGLMTEEIPVFHGYAAEGSSVRNESGVATTLIDPWAWVDGVPFTTPLATQVIDRSDQIASIFIDVLGDNLVVDASATGGAVCQPGVYTVSRGQAVNQLAEDGLLQVGFNALGQLIIKPQPDLTGILTPDWYFRTDQDSGLNLPAAPSGPATIITGTLERTRAWADALVNSVKVIPGGTWQLWSAQTARLDDESDPRHEDFIGVRQIEITSNTLGSAWAAYNLALTELTRRLRSTSERIKLSVAMNPAVEADDIISTAALPTLNDAGWGGAYIATSVTHAPSEAKTHIEAISALGYLLGT